MSKNNSATQPKEHIYIGVPPTATAPQIPQIPAPAHAPPPPLRRHQSKSQPIGVGRFFFFVQLAFFGVYVGYFTGNWGDDPTFRVEFATVFVHESRWIVGFSVTNRKLHSTIYYKYINVSIEEAVSSNKFSTAVIPPFTQRIAMLISPIRMMNSTIVMASWPDNKPGPHLGKYGLVFKTTIRFRAGFEYFIWPFNEPFYNDMEVLCKDVKVGFLSNVTQGVLLGGPIPCK